MDQTGVPLDELIKRWKAARAYLGVSQGELGRQLGISQATVKRIENDGSEIRKYLSGLARVAEVPYWFFEAPTLEELKMQAADPTDKLRLLEDRVGALELWRSALELEGLVPRGVGESEDPPSHGELP